MNTKTSLWILGALVAAVIIIVLVTPKRDDTTEPNEDRIDPVTGEVIETEDMVDEDGDGIADPLAPTPGEDTDEDQADPENPAFPRTGFEPEK